MGGRGTRISLRRFISDNGKTKLNIKYINNTGLTSEINKMYQGNRQNFGHMLDTFREKYKNSPKEHLIIVDKDGFATELHHGGQNSVGYNGLTSIGMDVIHNHPTDSVFSRTDIANFLIMNQKSITASGKSGDYILAKTAHADRMGFAKAVDAQHVVNDTFSLKNNESVEQGYMRISKEGDKWLSKNAPKYGYTYRYRQKGK